MANSNNSTAGRKQNRIKKEDEIPFTQVANHVLASNQLSAKAKGIYAYLYSKPDDWDFAVSRIKDEMENGRHSVRTALQELEDIGLLDRKKKQSGRVNYCLSWKINIGPDSEVPTMESSHDGKTPRISNKDNKSNKDKVSNKETTGSPDKTDDTTTENGESQEKEKAEHDNIVAVIDAFREWNPAAKRWYKNTTQRESAEILVDEFGLERVLQVVESVLPKTNEKPYLPKLTTPKQLLDGWESLRSGLKSEKAKDDMKNNNVAF